MQTKKKKKSQSWDLLLGYQKIYSALQCGGAWILVYLLSFLNLFAQANISSVTPLSHCWQISIPPKLEFCFFPPYHNSVFVSFSFSQLLSPDLNLHFPFQCFIFLLFTDSVCIHHMPWRETRDEALYCEQWIQQKSKLPKNDRFTSIFKMKSEQLSRALQLISSCLHLQLVSNAPDSSMRGCGFLFEIVILLCRHMNFSCRCSYGWVIASAEIFASSLIY